MHLKTGNFVTIGSGVAPSSSRFVSLTEGGCGSLLRIRASAESSNHMVMDGQEGVCVESAHSGKSIGSSPCPEAAASDTWRAMAVSGAREALRFTLSLHSKARPAFVTDWDSPGEASAQARSFLGGAKQGAERSRAQLAKEIAIMDGALGNAQRGFDETVLMVMLHFQNLHQALETRENLLLSRARALHSARCDSISQALGHLRAAYNQAEEGVELATR